jgi:hypothetical protein
LVGVHTGTMVHLVEQASSELTLGWSSAAAGETMFSRRQRLLPQEGDDLPELVVSRLQLGNKLRTLALLGSSPRDGRAPNRAAMATATATAGIHQAVSEPERSSGGVGGSSGDAHSGQDSA